jgi:predicted metalloprotease
VVVLGLIGWALGIDPTLLINGAEILTGGGQPGYQQRIPQQDTARTGTPSDETGRFVARILGSTEVQWKDIFSKEGGTYRAPRLVMFSGMTRSACGAAQSAMGPFYCPNDREIYLDTSFFRDLERRFQGCSGKACQFSQAYVIAHEVGHHVQNLLGILRKAQQAKEVAATKADGNRIQVQVELQADCLAGVWANAENESLKRQGKPPFIEAGDVEAALRTAAAIGDDTLQKKARGFAVPDSFTHGTSEQRRAWFTKGYESGDPAACDTFSVDEV